MVARFGFYGPDDWHDLLRMYLTFEPKAAYQGLPPYTEAVTSEWLSSLVKNPTNTHFVLRIGDRVAGHAALIYYPMELGSEEILIFVHQDFQGRGWGRRLFLSAMHWACRHKGLDRVWLTTDIHNTRARRLYRDIGFVLVPTDAIEPDELEMERPLQCKNCLLEKCPIYSADMVDVTGHGKRDRACVRTNQAMHRIWISI